MTTAQHNPCPDRRDETLMCILLDRPITSIKSLTQQVCWRWVMAHISRIQSTQLRTAWIQYQGQDQRVDFILQNLVPPGFPLYVPTGEEMVRKRTTSQWNGWSRMMQAREIISTEVTSSSFSSFFFQIRRYFGLCSTAMLILQSTTGRLAKYQLSHGCMRCYSTVFLRSLHDFRNVHALFPEMKDLLPLVHRKVRRHKILHFVQYAQ